MSDNYVAALENEGKWRKISVFPRLPPQDIVQFCQIKPDKSLDRYYGNEFGTPRLENIYNRFDLRGQAGDLYKIEIGVLSVKPKPGQLMNWQVFEQILQEQGCGLADIHEMLCFRQFWFLSSPLLFQPLQVLSRLLRLDGGSGRYMIKRRFILFPNGVLNEVWNVLHVEPDMRVLVVRGRSPEFRHGGGQSLVY